MNIQEYEFNQYDKYCKQYDERYSLIDNRIKEMEWEFGKLVDKQNELKIKLNSLGFWKRFFMNSGMDAINEKIDENRSLRNVLYLKRIEMNEERI